MSLAKRLDKLEKLAAARNPSTVVAVFLDVPGEDMALVQLADGTLAPCPNVNAVLRLRQPIKVYLGPVMLKV